MFHIYQVEVIPIKSQEHGKAVENFIEDAKATNLNGEFHTIYQDNGNVSFLSTLKNLREVEIFWTETIEKLGYEKAVKHIDGWQVNKNLKCGL